MTTKRLPSPTDTWVRGILRCPVNHCHLVDRLGPDGNLELWCVGECGSSGSRLAFPVVDGIPVLLRDEARAEPIGTSDSGSR